MLLLLSILVFLHFDIKKRKNQRLDFAHLKAGDFIGDFYLLCTDDTVTELTGLSEDNIIAIFVFSKKCLSCEPNYYFWKKLARQCGDKFTPFGVMLMEIGFVKDLSVPSDTPFSLHCPVDIVGFKETFKIKFDNTAKTTILKGRRILFSKAGEIGPAEFNQIKNILTRD